MFTLPATQKKRTPVSPRGNRHFLVNGRFILPMSKKRATKKSHTLEEVQREKKITKKPRQCFRQCVFIQGLMSAEGGTVSSIRTLPSSFPPPVLGPCSTPALHPLPPAAQTGRREFRAFRKWRVCPLPFPRLFAPPPLLSSSHSVLP